MSFYHLLKLTYATNPFEIDIFKLVCTHYCSSDAPRRDIISPIWVSGRITSHSRPQAWANLMLNRVRPWAILQNSRTEKPLITSLLPSFLYNIWAPKSESSCSKPSPRHPSTTLVLWHGWPPITAPQLMCRMFKPRWDVMDLCLTPIWWPSGPILNRQEPS